MMSKYIDKIFGKHKLLLVFTILSTFFLAFDGLVSPHFLGKFTDAMTVGAFQSTYKILIYWLLALFAIIVFQTIHKYLAQKLIRLVNLDVKSEIALSSLLSTNIQKSSSEYLSIITSEFSKIEEKFIRNIFVMFLCIFQGLITFFYLMTLNVKVGLVFVILGILPAVVPRLTSNWVKKGTKDWQKTNTVYLSSLEDFLKGRKLMLRFKAENILMDKLNEKLSNNEQSYFNMELIQTIANTIVSILYIGGLIGSLMIGIKEVVNGNLTTGQLITIYMAGDRVVSPLISAVSIYNVLQSTEPILEKIFNHDEPIHPYKLEFSSLNDDTDIVVQGLSVGYNNTSLIENINLQIFKDEKILITAASGSGKSSFIRTLMLDIPPISGNIIINERLKQSNPQELFGIVEQTPYIFNDTLLFNLTFGHSINKSLILNSLKQVGLGKFANDEQLYRVLNKDNNQLSGGELKRIEIARAIIFQKPILLIDEALSGLDKGNANRLNQLIINYPGTVLDIEHHYSDEMKERYDKILSIENKTLFSK